MHTHTASRSSPCTLRPGLNPHPYPSYFSEIFSAVGREGSLTLSPASASLQALFHQPVGMVSSLPGIKLSRPMPGLLTRKRTSSADSQTWAWGHSRREMLGGCPAWKFAQTCRGRPGRKVWGTWQEPSHPSLTHVERRPCTPLLLPQPLQAFTSERRKQFAG